jgi:hypothetical protein
MRISRSALAIAPVFLGPKLECGDTTQWNPGGDGASIIFELANVPGGHMQAVVPGSASDFSILPVVLSK